MKKKQLRRSLRYIRDYGGGLGAVPFPEPLMDWDAIRAAKLVCQKQCLNFCHLKDGCDFNLLPNEDCQRFERR